MANDTSAREDSPVQTSDYDAVLDRVEAQVGDLVAWVTQQKQLAREFSAAVLQLPDAESREEKVRALARVEPWSVAVALLHSALLTEEPDQSSTLAELAVAATEEMDAEAQPDSLKSGLLGQAYLLIAGGHFRADRSVAADEALEAAEAHLAEAIPGGPGPRLLRLLAALRSVRDRLAKSQGVLDALLQRVEEQYLATS